MQTQYWQYDVMKAIGVSPGKPGVKLIEKSEPARAKGEIKLEPLLVGICGTDREIISGYYGEAPPGEEFLTIGHESLCKVVEGQSNELKEGDLVVPTVRRSCGVCWSCLHGQSDMCFTGNFKERGIKGMDGYNTERVVELPEYIARVPDGLGDVAVLTEPMTIGEKAVYQCLELQKRVEWGWDCKEGLKCKKALVLGTGPVGLLASLILRLKGFKVVAADRHDDSTRKASILNAAGIAHLNTSNTSIDEFAGSEGKFDIIIEATGDAVVGLDAIPSLSPNGIIALTGIPGGSQVYQMPAVQIMRSIVLNNLITVGIVNANISYFKMALQHMLEIESKFPGLLERLISSKFAVEEYSAAFSARGADVVKVVIDWRR